MDINRRTFIFGTAAAAALAGRAAGSTGARSLKPGEKRTAAIIGCGGMNRGLMGQLLNRGIAPNVRVVAVCDCDRSRAAMFAKIVNQRYRDNKCRVSYDFRELVADPGIDIFCIATPDHWHAYIAVEAMKHGKDVYCEKPLTYSIEEAKQVMAAQKKYGRVLQTGSWQRSDRVFRDAVALVRGGLVGNVRYVDANYGAIGKFGGPSHPVRFWNDPANAAKEGAPNPDIDWPMWLGPARMRPYSSELSFRGPSRTPMFWRCDDDLASGMNGDWGAHHLDIVQWALDMDDGGPYRVIRSDEPHSTNLYHGGRRQWGMGMLFKKPYGDVKLYHGPFSVFWADNPAGRKEWDSRGHGWGAVFYGDTGIVAVNRGKIAVWTGTGPVKPDLEIRRQIEKCTFMPDKIAFSSITPGAPKLGKVLDGIEAKYKAEIKKANLYYSAHHMKDFLACVESRRLPITHAGVGGHSSILCQLCNLSYKYDTGFDWDPEKMEFANGTGKGIPLGRVGDCNGWKVEV